MKKVLKRIAALLLVALVGVSSVGCGFELEQPEFIKQALCDHVFDEEEILKEPTCGEKGKKEEICSDCGKTRITTIRATGEHVYDEGMQEDGTIRNIASWNKRITADGLSILDGSQASLRKVEGTTIVRSGKLVSPSFSGICSTDAKGKEYVLEFPKTNLPLGVEIDFNANTITDRGRTIVFDADYIEKMQDTDKEIGVQRNGSGFIVSNAIPEGEDVELTGVSSIGYAVGKTTDKQRITVGYPAGPRNILMVGLPCFVDYNTSENSDFIDWLNELNDAGTPLEIRYISTINEEKTTFESNNKYPIYRGGTEMVIGNDGAEHGVNPTLTVDYVCACTVCGQAMANVESQKPKCAHQKIDDVGECLVCGANVFDAATTSVNVGDEAYGWYRLDKKSAGFSLGFSSINCGGYPIDSGSKVLVAYKFGPEAVSFDTGTIILNDRYIMSYLLFPFSTVSLDDYYYFYIPEVVVGTVNISRDDSSVLGIELRMSFIIDSFEGLEKVLVS